MDVIRLWLVHGTWVDVLEVVVPDPRDTVDFGDDGKGSTSAAPSASKKKRKKKKKKGQS